MFLRSPLFDLTLNVIFVLISEDDTFFEVFNLNIWGKTDMSLSYNKEHKIIKTM